MQLGARRLAFFMQRKRLLDYLQDSRKALSAVCAGAQARAKGRRQGPMQAWHPSPWRCLPRRRRRSLGARRPCRVRLLPT